MRLKLNKTLRAALIAAITTVGLTLTQAEAVMVTAQTITFAPTGTGVGQWGGTSASDCGLTASGWSLTKVQGGSDVGTKGITNQLRPDTNVETESGWILSFSITNSGDTAQTIDTITLNSFLFNSSNGYQGNGTARLFNTALTFGGETYSAENYTITSNGGADPASGVLSYTLNAPVSIAAGASETFTFKMDKGTNESNGCFAGLTSIVMSRNVVSETSNWNGTEDHHTWSDASSWDRAFHSGDVAVFGDSAVIKDVTVNQAVVADEIRVTGGAYTLASAGADKTIATGKLSVSDGASVAFAGEGAVTIDTLTGAGNLVVGADANVSVNALSSYTGAMSVTDGGTLTVGFAINKETLTIADGTLNLGSNRHTIATLTIGDGGLVTTTRSDGNGCVSGDIDIKAGGTFRVAGQHDAFGWGGNATKNIILTGESDTKRAELQFQQTTDYSATFATNLKLKGHALVSTTKNGFNTYGGSIYAEGVDNTIEKFQLRRAATIEVAENGELTVGEMVYGADSTHDLTKTGAGTLTFTGTAKMQALNLLDGSLVINGGTTTVAGDSTTSTLNKTITVSAGSLVLHGTYEIGGNTGEMKTTYVGGATEGNGNGFEHVAGSSKVYTKAAEGASVNVEGATFTVGGEDVTSAVVDGVYTTQGSTNFGTFYVKNGTESLDHALTFADGHTVSSVSLANGTTIDMDRTGASIGLVLENGASATVNATAAGTVSSITGWSGNTLTITGGAEVSLMPGQDIVIGAGSSLLVNTDVAAQKIQLNGDGAHLTVDSGGELTLTNNLTLTKGVADVYGTMNVGHEVDLSNGSQAKGTLHIYGTGRVTVKDGMWMNHTAVGVLLEEGGTLTITGKGVKFTGKEDGSIKVADGKEMNYTVGNTDALISNVTMEALGDITIANQLANVDVVTGAHTVRLNTDADSVTVSDGGTFYLNDGKTVTNITVEDGGTIAGGVDAKNVGIEAGATATFAQGVSDEAHGVTFKNEEGSAVAIKNTGTAPLHYDATATDAKVTADILVVDSETDVTVKNKVVVGDIANIGEGDLTLTHVDVIKPLKGVYAHDGALTLQNITEVSVVEMEIASGSTVAVYTSENADVEGTVTITDKLEAGGGTLLANLEMANGSKLALSLVDGGGRQALTLGSQFTIAEGALVRLDDATLEAIADLTEGQEVILIKALQENGHELTSNLQNGALASLYFNGVDAADYTMVVNANEIAIKKAGAIPEPTTGTLSLLALAGLCARRRKK